MLHSKTFLPPLASDLIPRQRLFDLLDAGLDKVLILISAPPGYGKTSLISAWLRQTRTPAAWLSLDAADNDPIRFLHGLFAALEPLLPDAIPELEGQLSSSTQPIQPRALISRLVTELSASPTPAFLVLDDFHVLHHLPIIEIIHQLLDRLPPLLHLIILTRADPALPLPRLRAAGQLAEIRAENLGFTLAETASFLHRACGQVLVPADLAALHARTEGWAAGLRLAALTLRGHPDAHDFVSAFSGSHRYVMDYLIEEAFKRQPESIRVFLMRTSILERMNAALCDAVVKPEEDAPFASADVLLEMERLNLFVVPLDERQEWYRYHVLFADVLQRRLRHKFPDLLPELHRRASAWFQQNGFFSDAVRHALLAGDRDQAARLIESDGCFVLVSGETATLVDWLEAIPYDARAHPWLAIQKAWALAVSGRCRQALEALQTPSEVLDGCPDTVETRTMLGTIAAARAYCANAHQDPSTAAKFARQALELLPDCSAIARTLRSAATSILGDSSWINGDLEQAAHAYSEAVRLGRQAENLNMASIASCNLAEVLAEEGRLQSAYDLYQEALLLTVRPDGRRSPLAGRINVGRARLAYELNQLTEAEQAAQSCLEISLPWGEIGDCVEANLILAAVERARGNVPDGQKAMRAAERLIHDAGLHGLAPHRMQELKSHLARLWLRLGHLEQTLQYIQKNHLNINDEISYQREADYILLLRAFLARRSFDGALRLCVRLLRGAEAGSRTGRLIELLVLQALIYQGKKDLDRALPALEKALTLAAPEGFRRVFLDEGQPLLKLLCQLQARRPENMCAEELIGAFGQPAQPAAPDLRLLFEPLTSRELEIVRLIEAGSSNQEIAEKLVISLATVKRHISNIYTKLGVKSRTQALSICRELKLFD